MGFHVTIRAFYGPGIFQTCTCCIILGASKVTFCCTDWSGVKSSIPTSVCTFNRGKVVDSGISTYCSAL